MRAASAAPLSWAPPRLLRHDAVRSSGPRRDSSSRRNRFAHPTGLPMAADAQLQKLSRELFLAAVAPPSIPGWVIERTASALEERAVNEGDVLFNAGDPPAYIYFMRE